MKFIYLICASALTFTTACSEEAKTTETHTETIREVEVEKETPETKVVIEEDKEATEVSVSPNSGSLKTKGLEVEVNK